MKRLLLIAVAATAFASGSAMAEGCAYGHSAKYSAKAADPKAEATTRDPQLLAQLKEKEAQKQDRTVIHN